MQQYLKFWMIALLMGVSNFAHLAFAQAPPQEAKANEAQAEISDQDALTRLKEIENQVSTLKEETYDLKSRLMLLKAQVLQRTAASSRVLVKYESELGMQYQMWQLIYTLDGEPLPILQGENIERMNGQYVIDRNVVPGKHHLQIKLLFKGNTLGVFQYMSQYIFTLTSSYDFRAEEGKVHEIKVRIYERGGVFTPFENRPSIEYQKEDYGFESFAKISQP